MKKISKIIAVILCCVAVMISSAVFAHAEGGTAQAAISVNSSVKVGSEFTVTVKFTSSTEMGSTEAMLKYDPKIIEFVSGSDAHGTSGAILLSRWCQNPTKGDNTVSFSLKFKAKAAGSSSLSLTGIEVCDYANGVPLNTVETSKSVQVIDEIPLSSNNYLSDIKLSSGTLSPKFTKKTLNYTVNVSNQTDTIRITATCEDSKAKCNVSGSGSLKVGSNTVKITVTAENGEKKTYTIKVKRASAESEAPVSSAESVLPPIESQPLSPSINIIVDGNEYSVMENFENIVIPDGFAETVCTVNGTQVMAVTNSTGSVVMLYLINAEQVGEFFVYDTAEISYIPYRTLTVGQNTYIPLSKPRGLAIPDGFKPTELHIGEQSYQAWVSNDSDSYYMLYLCNVNGTPTLYVYDTLEGTMQRHQNLETVTVDAPVIDTPTKDNESKILFYTCVALAAAIIILITVVIILAVKCNKGKKTQKTNEDELIFAENDFAEVEQSHIIEATAVQIEEAPVKDDSASDDGDPSFSDDFIIR